MRDEAREDHAAAVGRLRACVERGNERVTMIDMPEAPTSVGHARWNGKHVDQSRWDGNGLSVVVRGPLPAGLEYLAGDLVVRFIKHARVDIQAWDQGDRSVWWQPGAEFLGESPWFPINPDAQGAAAR